MRLHPLLLALACGALITGCSPEDDEEGALGNYEDNPQEYYNTATDPAGPREINPPSDVPNQ